MSSQQKRFLRSMSNNVKPTNKGWEWNVEVVQAVAQVLERVVTEIPTILE